MAESTSNESYGWHFQYLTIIGLSLALLTFFAASLADISSSSALFRLKNALSVASAPLEVLISLLYWGIRAIDTSLVLPPDIEPLPTHAGKYLKLHDKQNASGSNSALPSPYSAGHESTDVRQISDFTWHPQSS